MKVLRTPEERFRDLPGFPFAPHYAEVADGEGQGGTLRMHYLDEGPRKAEAVLLLHGEPSWCFLYRRVLAVLVAAGHRCIAPDLVGFGRSDKPAERSDHSYARQVAWLAELVFEHLDLQRITLVAQDWGGLVGLRLLAAQPDRFARVVAANTGLPTGEERVGAAFRAWQRFSQETPVFAAGQIVAAGCTRPLDPEVAAAYDAPFPDQSYTAGARALPLLVPTSTADPAHQDNRAAWSVLRGFTRPFLCAFSDQDPITAGADRRFLAQVPGTAGLSHPTVEGAGHFLQEDAGERLGQIVADFLAAV